MVLLFLNTTRPPFVTSGRRRAVNYAVDRTAHSPGSSEAPGFAQLTCQPRPPGTVGSGATAPILRPRARRASGRRLTSRVRAASSPLRGRGA